MSGLARERLIVVILGAQGTGKTTLARALVKAARARGERVRTLSVSGWGETAEEPERWAADRVAKRDATLVLFDDGDRYIPKKPRDKSPWRTLALTNRHVGVDVLVTGRRLQALPDELISGIDYLYLFQVSRADVNALRRLAVVAEDVEIPTEPYRFVRLEPKTATGNVVRGHTDLSGGYRLEDPR